MGPSKAYDFDEFEEDVDANDDFETGERKAMAKSADPKVFTKSSSSQPEIIDGKEVVRRGSSFTVVRPQSATTAVRSSAPGAGRAARPQSATNRSHYRDLKMKDMKTRDPKTWNVSEVAMWMEEIGFTNHRQKFIHNAVDGRLLLRLTSDNLKHDLGIMVLGHRERILEEVAYLKEDREEESRKEGGGGGKVFTRAAHSAGTRERPGHEKGGALGALSVEEHRAKIVRDLDRARSASNHKRMKAEDMMRQAKLAEAEVKRVQGQLADLDKKVRRKQMANSKMDLDAVAPWKPSRVLSKDSATDAKEFSTSDRSNETFRPRLSRKSIEIMHEGRGEEGSDFIKRMQGDLRNREEKIKEKRRFYQSVALGAEGEKAAEISNLKFLKEEFKTRVRFDLPNGPDSTIDQAIETYQEDLGLKPRQLQNLDKLKGRKKRMYLEEALKSNVFMSRYESDMKKRDRNKKEVVAQLRRQEHQHMSKPPDQRDIDDRAGYFDHFRRLGWDKPEDRGEVDRRSDERLNALLERAADVREASAAGQPLDEEFGRDVLAQLAGRPLAGPRKGERAVDEDEQRALDRDQVQRQMAALDDTVRLLAAMPREELTRCQKLVGDKKRLACFRALKRQVFLARTAEDLRKREIKIDMALHDPPRAPRADRGLAAEEFMNRLETDLARREAKKAELAEKERRRKEELVLRGVY